MRSDCKLVSLLVLLCALFASTVSAQDDEALKKQASQRFATGVELVSEGNYEGALVEFRRAYELVPDWRLLYNMAQVLQMMQDYPAAMEHFERYLKEGGERVAEARRESVLAELEKLKARVAYLEVTVDEPGAEVVVDDRVRGTSPLAERLAVSVGRRHVVVRKAGFEPVERFVEVGGGESTPLRFELGSARQASASLDGTGDTMPTPVERKVPWALWGVTGGLAVGAGVAGALAMMEKKDAEKLADDGPSTKKKLDAGKNRALAYGVGSDVLAVGAVAVGVFALYKTFWAKPETAEARVRADVGLARASVTLRF